MVIVINFVIGGFGWVDLIGRFSCPITGAWLQPTDGLQLYRMISEI